MSSLNRLSIFQQNQKQMSHKHTFITAALWDSTMGLFRLYLIDIAQNTSTIAHKKISFIMSIHVFIRYCCFVMTFVVCVLQYYLDMFTLGIIPKFI